MEGRRSSGDRSGLYGYTCKFIYTCPSILEGVHSALQYRDLYDMLYRAAINAGARITYGATVTSVHANPPALSFMMAPSSKQIWLLALMVHEVQSAKRSEGGQAKRCQKGTVLTCNLPFSLSYVGNGR